MKKANSFQTNIIGTVNNIPRNQAEKLLYK